MSLKYVAGRSGRVVMTEELLPAPIPASKAALREVILPLLDESDEPYDDDNLIDYGLDSVRMMALAARWRKVHGDIDFVMLAKNPTIDAWWKLLPASKAALREVILPLLDESDEPFDDDNLIDYGLDSVRMMALAARWRKVHGDIDCFMLAKNPTIDAWWKLLSREVK